MKTLLRMTNPTTGKRECYSTPATPEEVQRQIEEVFSAAGYYDFEIEEREG